MNTPRPSPAVGMTTQTVDTKNLRRIGRTDITTNTGRKTGPPQTGNFFQIKTKKMLVS